MIYTQKNHHNSVHHKLLPHTNHPQQHTNIHNTFNRFNKHHQKINLDSNINAANGGDHDTCEKPLNCHKFIGPIKSDNSHSPHQHAASPSHDTTVIKHQHREFDDYFPAKPQVPLLVLSPQSASLLDPLNIESYYSLWSVFSKCSTTLENGRRLENMSWRLWNRELLLDDDSSSNCSTNSSLASSISSITEICCPAISSDAAVKGGTNDRFKRSHSVVESKTKRFSTTCNVTSTNNTTDSNTRDIPQHTNPLGRRNTYSGVVRRLPSTQTLNVASSTVNPSSTARRHASLFPSNTNNNSTRNLASQPSQRSHPASNTIHKQSLHKNSPIVGINADDRQLKSTSSLFNNPPARKPVSLFPKPSASQLQPTKVVSPRDKRYRAVVDSDSDDDDLSTDDDNDVFVGPHLHKSATRQNSTSSQPNQHQISSTTSTTSIVRGFGPSQVSISVRSSANLHDANPATTTDKLNESLTKARPNQVAKENMFFIESSSSLESEKNNSLTSSFSPTKPGPAPPAKVNSLFVEPKAGLKKDSVSANQIESDDDDDDFDSDDFLDSDDEEDFDNNSAWDSVDDESDNSGSVPNNSAFERVDSRPRLLNRPSLLSSLFLNKLNDTQTMDSEDTSASTGDQYTHVFKSSMSKVAAAAATTTTHDLHSPRTTRRNMLACELSDSVRRDLIRERKQISNVSREDHKIVRRHTSVDMLGLSNYQQQQKLDENWNSLTCDFDYHARGW